MKQLSSVFKTAKLFICTILLCSCASLDGPTEPHDPWERFNRGAYKFNDALDRKILQPTARGYRKITPDPVEKGVGNFFSNLDDVTVLANNLLQLKIKRALSDTGRLLVNSTLGMFGVFDVASHLGLKKHNEDFGQTLGRWGAKTGPYFVIPFLGSSSVRDGIGRVVDIPLSPTLSQIDETGARVGLYLLDVVNIRAQLLEAGEILDEAAFDPYIFVREAYLQSRENLVYDGNAPQKPSEDDDFDIFSD